MPIGWTLSRREQNIAHEIFIELAIVKISKPEKSHIPAKLGE
jgi:hypothetical protein